MAELSALGDKFDTWVVEEPKYTKRPPAGKPPAALAKMNIPGGSARITGYNKRTIIRG